MDLPHAKVRHLLPGVRRGFVISTVPIAVLAALLWDERAAGTTAWVAVRVCLSLALWWWTRRLGDGGDEAPRTLRHLAIVMALSSLGWGLIAVMIETSSVTAQSVVLFAVVTNIAIVTVTCASDRTVYLAAVVPVFVVGVAGMLVRRDDGPLVLPLLAVLALPYSFAMFATAHRGLLEGFELERRNAQLVDELEQRHAQLAAANERLLDATAHQALQLDERAALISSVGHDLGSPLGAALLTAEVLAERSEAVPAELRGELAARIRAQVHDAMTVLRDLTSSERLQRHDLVPSLVELELAPVVDDVSARHRSAGSHQIVNLVPADLTVCADAGLLERILDNLVGNARKYTPVGGLIEIGASADDAAVELWVDDDGPGLPEGRRDDVFEPYVRGPSPSSTSGSGVGLYLVRSFAAHHGGRVWWEPSERGGSRFVVSLPRHDRLTPGAVPA